MTYKIKRKVSEDYIPLSDDTEKALDKYFVNREKKCPYCKSDDTYLTELKEGFHYRCNKCGEYFK